MSEQNRTNSNNSTHSTILIGLDPGSHIGGAVALLGGRVLGAICWADTKGGYHDQVEGVGVMSGVLSRSSFMNEDTKLRLCHEKIAHFQKSAIAGCNRSVGIWLSLAPDEPLCTPPNDWRKDLGIQVKLDTEKMKAASLALVRQLIETGEIQDPEGRLTPFLARDHDDIAEACLIAYWGERESIRIAIEADRIAREKAAIREAKAAERQAEREARKALKQQQKEAEKAKRAEEKERLKKERGANSLTERPKRKAKTVHAEAVAVNA